jgi:hypothetical protein
MYSFIVSYVWVAPHIIDSAGYFSSDTKSKSVMEAIQYFQHGRSSQYFQHGRSNDPRFRAVQERKLNDSLVKHS